MNEPISISDFDKTQKAIQYISLHFPKTDSLIKLLLSKEFGFFASFLTSKKIILFIVQKLEYYLEIYHIPTIQIQEQALFESSPEIEFFENITSIKNYSKVNQLLQKITPKNEIHLIVFLATHLEFCLSEYEVS